MKRAPGKSARAVDTYAPVAAVQRSAGKSSRSGAHYAGVVQASGDLEGPAVHQAAARGISGSATDLPFLDVIQRSFGGHDLGGVRAHTDASAREAGAAIGATAYATGDHVAFAGTPDLHTAAHEAAHVVQQRGGVQLAGGTGASGDAYERHADAVADRVVRGESAEDLLDGMAAGSAKSGAVQRHDAQGRQAELGKIHYHAMSGLLRMLERLKPFSAEDYAIARQSFGPRLVVAMKAVATRAPWGSGEMSALPQDQQEDIRRYLGVTRMLPEGAAGFNQFWGAHPHDYKDDPAQNTTGDEVREEHELPAAFENTCAIRLSIMLNGSGHTITPATAKAAGIARRPHYSSKTRQYYIISAAEMWSYLAKHFRGPDLIFPADGRYKSSSEFLQDFSRSIAPVVASRKGIVAFESIFGFSGTGHIDLFDGGQLSDSASWYPCKRLHLWYVAV